MGSEDLSVGGCQATHARIRDLETIDAELQLVVAFRRQARERGWPLPSIDAADALLDERGKLGEWAGRSRERDVSGLRAVHRAHTSEP